MNTVETWLEAACADADRRGLPALKPLLANLAAAMRTVRAADWNDAADRGPTLAPVPAPPAAGDAASPGATSGDGGGR